MNNLSVTVWIEWPLWMRYLWALLNQVPQLLGSLVWIANVLITLAAIAGVWLLRKYDVKRSLKVILTIVVFLVSVGVTIWVSYKFRTLVADEARNRSDEAFKLADAEFNKTKSNKGAGDQDARTNALINTDQAIAKITSQIYLVVYYKFPEIRLRSISIHLLRPLALGKKSDDVVNLVQEGREKKDAPALALSDSFIGYTMQQDAEQYCPDIRSKESEACTNYRVPVHGFPDYVSLLCYPLGESVVEAKRAAGICFDSKIPHAFDGEAAELVDAVTPQLNSLSTLLTDFRDLLAQQINAPQSSVTPPWLPQGTLAP